MRPIDSIFVYGTLKQNHLRASRWPCKPLSIRQATIHAALYDTGPFPAILAGDDWVLGELWTLSVNDMPRTLEVLDEVEGYDASRQQNLYIRVEMEAMLDVGTLVRAFTYQYAATGETQALRRILPHCKFVGRLCAAWPDALARVPRSYSEE